MSKRTTETGYQSARELIDKYDGYVAGLGRLSWIGTYSKKCKAEHRATDRMRSIMLRTMHEEVERRRVRLYSKLMTMRHGWCVPVRQIVPMHGDKVSHGDYWTPRWILEDSTHALNELRDEVWLEDELAKLCEAEDANAGTLFDDWHERSEEPDPKQRVSPWDCVGNIRAWNINAQLYNLVVGQIKPDTTSEHAEEIMVREFANHTYHIDTHGMPGGERFLLRLNISTIHASTSHARYLTA